MKTKQRALVALASLLVTVVLAAGVSPAAAQATPPDRVEDGQATAIQSTRANGDLVVRLPSRASVETTVAAPPPTTSPAPEHRYFVTSLSGVTCPVGRACAVVPYGGGWYVFNFYRYGTYAMSWWYGWGWVMNNQTGGAAVRLGNSGGGEVRCLPPNGWVSIAWTPIWSIRLTASPC